MAIQSCSFHVPQVVKRRIGNIPRERMLLIAALAMSAAELVVILALVAHRLLHPACAIAG